MRRMDVELWDYSSIQSIMLSWKIEISTLALDHSRHYCSCRWWLCSWAPIKERIIILPNLIVDNNMSGAALNQHSWSSSSSYLVWYQSSVHTAHLYFISIFAAMEASLDNLTEATNWLCGWLAGWTSRCEIRRLKDSDIFTAGRSLT